MGKLSILLDEIFNKPGYYVGGSSITRLQGFINGYKWAKLEIGEDVEDTMFDNFQEWVSKKLDIETSHGWYEKLLFYFGDETEAFKKAKEFWEEYKSELNSTRSNEK